MTAAPPFEGHACQADPGIDLAVVQFVVAAKEFCRLIESEAALPQRELLHQLLRATLALYSAGLALPEVDPELDDRDVPFFDQNSRRMFREQLAERLGNDPEIQHRAILADHLAGIYIAVKEGLLNIPGHAGRVPGFVIWNWTFALENDAGRRAISAIGALHSLLFGG